MKRFGIFAVGVLFLFFDVTFAQASVWITEISYNPEGADSGYEWVEVWNNTEQTIEALDLVLRENEVNHGIKAYSGKTDLAPGEYGVIADKPASFKEQYDEYSGVLLDSAFSLSNSGELLQLINQHDQLLFTVEYNSDSGGNGDGSNLGLVGDVWQAVMPSPGMGNSTWVAPITETHETGELSAETNPDATAENSNMTIPADLSPATYIEIKNPDYHAKVIKVDAGGDRTVMAGVSYWFSGTVYGLQGGELENPQVRWNWGDGNTGEGPSDMHTYQFPGTYTMTMSASVVGTSGRDRSRVTVIEPALSIDLDISESVMLLGIANTSPYYLEVSDFLVSIDGGEFVFPDDSFVSPGETLWLSAETLGMSLAAGSVIDFTDGIGQLIDRVHTAELLLQDQVSQVQAAQVAVNQEPTESATVERTNPTENVPTHSQVFVYPEPAEPQLERAVEIPEAAAEQFEIPDHTRDAPQQAHIAGAVERKNFSWHVWALGVIACLLGGLYLHESRTKTQRSYSDIDIID